MTIHTYIHTYIHTHNYYTYVQHVDVDHRHRLTRMLVCGSGRLAEAEAKTVYLVLGCRGYRLEPGVLLQENCAIHFYDLLGLS